MDEIERRIEELEAQERELISREEEGGADDVRDAIQGVRIELDRQWDLLRQRRALEEAGRDPDEASLRDAETVEGYEQ